MNSGCVHTEVDQFTVWTETWGEPRLTASRMHSGYYSCLKKGRKYLILDQRIFPHSFAKIMMMAIFAIMRLREKRRNSLLTRIPLVSCRRNARYQMYRREQQKSLGKMVVQSTICNSIQPTVEQRKLWSKPRDDNWWDTIVKQKFDEKDGKKLPNV